MSKFQAPRGTHDVLPRDHLWWRVIRTIEQLRAEISTKTGENVVIRRFARFQVGD